MYLLTKCCIINHTCLIMHVSFYVLTFPLCVIHSTLSKHHNKTLYFEIPSNIHTSTPILTHICDQKEKRFKQQADHSDWYNPTYLHDLCLYYIVSQVITPDVFTDVNTRKGVKCWPPESEYGLALLQKRRQFVDL